MNQVLFATFEKEAETSGNERLLLTAAVAAAKVNIDKAYEVDKLVPQVSFSLLKINLSSFPSSVMDWYVNNKNQIFNLTSFF